MADFQYEPKHEPAGLPFDIPAAATTLYYLHKTAGADITGSGPLYILQAARNGVLQRLREGIEGESKRRWAESLFGEYVDRAPEFGSLLMAATPKDQVSAIVCVPTKRKRFMAPYRIAAATICDKALDLTDYLSAQTGWSSDETLPLDKKITQLDFRPAENLDPGNHLLVVDDVINSGASAAAVIQKVTGHYAPTAFTLTVACPLWIARGT